MAKTVLITGASSGIGKALALEFSRRGYHLGLVSRRLEALESLAAQIQATHPSIQVECRALNVNEIAQIKPVIQDLRDSLGKLDIVIANAGIGGGSFVGSGHLNQDLAIIQTNVAGAMATIDAAVEIFKKQHSGHIVGISSVAAYRGMPGSAAYCASKAAIATYLDALTTELYHTPIKVTTLYPGYIDTPLNNMLKKRPFLIDVNTGAGIMANLIEKEVTVSTVPVYPWSMIGKLLKNIPRSMLAKRKAP
ncbi:short chain dehydrogenase [Hahella sp. CCB-MM4]|uniref:SDR family oxidoreductase n=1 Tax=Hahella sp. (strain CCB-MM4) TaxID=1926491 RepID=UPI000B9A6FF1|nr:SDR family oxidoreductase [Hahella sp. CCB-MM4]OZG75345.1 short chain dehydrogenase [Hahella sp. CCB-MM4]